jgi:hypothetical protein
VTSLLAIGEHRPARASTRSSLLRRLLEEWPEIKAPRVTELLRAEYGYWGSIDVVRRRLRELRPRSVRPAQRTGYRPGQVLQLDWTEMPTRPRGPDAGGVCTGSWRACPTRARRPPSSAST